MHEGTLTRDDFVKVYCHILGIEYLKLLILAQLGAKLVLYWTLLTAAFKLIAKK